ncbi:hypothetical protein R3Q06_32365 [Rhodococcus erythropolis]|uniref:hypothetical protein n=1 Tax=Rhodococcus erythropolis TaxID=1833 RepID=UPI002949CCA5|nr:hypothetical protein [Rhodococcus erythropolis]MDV6278164.1 hypothetical protein [Rhodococcus erythropolis]
MTITTKKSRLRRAGRVTSVFLASAVAAGGICGGAGISAAATPDTPSTVSPDAPQSGTSSWSVTNRTGEPVWGYLEIEKGSSTGSRIGWPKDAPVPSGAGDRKQVQGSGNLYTQGRICYRGAWWNLPRDNYGGTENEVDHWNLVAAVYDRDTLTVEDAERRYVKPMPMIRTPGDSGCGSMSSA